MGFRFFSSVKFLRIALGIFFLVLGFYGISQSINEGIFGLNNPVHKDNQTIEIIFGIIELLCGFLLLSGLFVFGSSSAVHLGGLIVLIFWLARIVLQSFIWGIIISDRGISFRPNIYQWVLTFVTSLLIASAINVVVNRYDNR